MGGKYLNVVSEGSVKGKWVMWVIWKGDESAVIVNRQDHTVFCSAQKSDRKAEQHKRLI